MEAEIARRRVSTIAGHIVAGEDFPATHHHILPMNCSGSLSSPIRRLDNRILFARQASRDQGCFMRQASSTDQAISSGQPAAGVKCHGSERSCNYAHIRSPIFSRPTRTNPNLPRVSLGLPQPMVQGCTLNWAEPPPQFARPNRGITVPRQPRPTSKKPSPPKTNGTEWSPRMDIAESGQSYVLTVEIPGVSAKDIRVEVNDRNLVVMGKRTTQSWKVAKLSNNSISSYHRREILRGPYQVVWPLPNNVNKDSVSAEFSDGFLQVIVPKL